MNNKTKHFLAQKLTLTQLHSQPANFGRPRANDFHKISLCMTTKLLKISIINTQIATCKRSMTAKATPILNKNTGHHGYS